MQELRKNMNCGKIIPDLAGWGVVRPKAEKKIVSVGAISTFRHPLGVLYLLQPLVYAIKLTLVSKKHTPRVVLWEIASKLSCNR